MASFVPSPTDRRSVRRARRSSTAWSREERRRWAQKRTLVETGLELPSETVLSFYDPDPDVDVSSLLSQVRVPTLVTHGRADELIPFSAAEHLAGALPHGRLYAFEDKGHLPIFTAPDEFCTVIRESVAAPVQAARAAARR